MHAYSLFLIVYIMLFSGIILLQDSYDSRTFGPVSMTNIVGRVIYCLRNEVDHGPVANRLASLCYTSIFSLCYAQFEYFINFNMR